MGETRIGQPRGRALVTGASRGIGRATAEALARAGYEVIGTTRDVHGIPAEAALSGVKFLPLDLTDQRSIDRLVDQVGDIDVLINNAGTSQLGPVEEVSVDAVRRLFELNLFGILRLTQGILPSMRRRRKGRIINISSLAGLSPVPFISVYAATKAALIAISRGLRFEVSRFGIYVSVLAPADISTTIPLDKQYGDNSPYTPSVLKVREARDRFMAEAPGPKVVAKKILRILASARPRPFYTAGRLSGPLAFLLRRLPMTTIETFTRKLFGVN